MDTTTIDQATDVLQATLQDLKKRRCVLTYAYSNYGSLNTTWQGRLKTEGGDKVERYITLRDEGNAKHAGNWEEDTHNVVNTDETITANWKRATSNFSYNTIEISMNMGAARIYNKVENKYNNCLRELADKLYEQQWTTPATSSDALNPFGIPGWYTLGTDDSTGGWTGYTGDYASSGTFNCGGIASSSTVNPRWASYYADHNSDYDESLLVLLDRACRKLHFEAPMFPKRVDTGAELRDKYSLYSNDTIISNINLLYAQTDDQMGYRINSHFGVPEFRGMPFQYVDVLDTANTTVRGGNPIYGVNHELMYPCILGGWDFNIAKPVQRQDQHVVLTVYMDVVYTYVCEDRRRAGFLISSQ